MIVTFSPLWLETPFHASVICWLPGNVNFKVQPLRAAEPVSASVTLAVKPPVHWEVVEYVTWHDDPEDEDDDTVQVNVAEPDAPVPSVAVTVTEYVPAVVGVPLMSPEEESDSPAGSPDAEYVSVCPDAESDAATCTEAGEPTTDDCAPGFVTVTVLPEEEPDDGIVNVTSDRAGRVDVKEPLDTVVVACAAMSDEELLR